MLYRKENEYKWPVEKQECKIIQTVHFHVTQTKESEVIKSRELLFSISSIYHYQVLHPMMAQMLPSLAAVLVFPLLKYSRKTLNTFSVILTLLGTVGRFWRPELGEGNGPCNRSWRNAGRKPLCSGTLLRPGCPGCHWVEPRTRRADGRKSSWPERMVWKKRERTWNHEGRGRWPRTLQVTEIWLGWHHFYQ